MHWGTGFYRLLFRGAATINGVRPKFSYKMAAGAGKRPRALGPLQLEEGSVGVADHLDTRLDGTAPGAVDCRGKLCIVARHGIH